VVTIERTSTGGLVFVRADLQVNIHSLACLAPCPPSGSWGRTRRRRRVATSALSPIARTDDDEHVLRDSSAQRALDRRRVPRCRPRPYRGDQLDVAIEATRGAHLSICDAQVVSTRHRRGRSTGPLGELRRHMLYFF